MSRIIGIDYGKKRVGVAVSDPLNIIAQPLGCVGAEQIIAFLQEYAQKESITKFVVGYPKNLDNSPAECAIYVEQFLKRLKKSFPTTEVELEDERFTTVLAQRAMIEGGMKKSRRAQKGEADKISAVLILQSYLDRQSRV